MGMIFKGLTFGGINSLDYGIFITGEAVYNAPERSVTSIEIEGRNGDLLIDNGRFLNIEVSYPAGCFAESQEDFKEKIELFRNAIISQISYQRLTDDYNPDEYRLAVYKSGLEVNVAVLHQGGEFTLTFDCKPQRFLTSGETERSIPEWSDLHTDSGSLVTVDNSSGDYVVKSLSMDIVPQQSGSGDPSPSNVRPITGFDSADINVSGKNWIADFTETSCCEKVSDHKYKVTKTSTTIATRSGSANSLMKGGTQYTISYNADLSNISINVATSVQYTDNTYSSNLHSSTSGNNTFNFTPTKDVKLFQFYLGGGDSTGIGQYAIITNLMARLSSDTDATFKPYNGNTYTVSFGSAGTVYGGTIDVVSGQLKVERAFITLDETANWSWSTITLRPHVLISGMEIKGAVISNMYPYSSSVVAVDGTITTNGGNGKEVWIYDTVNAPDLNSWKTFVASNNLQVVYTLATPLTYQLTATQVAFLLGTNNFWSNIGDVQIEYGKGGNTLYNPTLFDSSPLIKVTGTGTLGIGDWILTITGLSSQTLYIDCEMMEVYKNTGGIIEGANSLVSINKNTFPKLVSGMNNITKTSGLTNLKITPRWWRI